MYALFRELITRFFIFCNCGNLGVSGFLSSNLGTEQSSTTFNGSRGRLRGDQHWLHSKATKI